MFDTLFDNVIGKDYDELSDWHKRRRKKEIKVNYYLNGLQEVGLEPVSLHLKTQNESEVFVRLGLDDETCQSTSPNHDDLIPSFLYLLLKYGLSNEYYYEMTKLLPELPKSHKVAKILDYS